MVCQDHPFPNSKPTARRISQLSRLGSCHHPLSPTDLNTVLKHHGQDPYVPSSFCVGRISARCFLHTFLKIFFRLPPSQEGFPVCKLLTLFPCQFLCTLLSIFPLALSAHLSYAQTLLTHPVCHSNFLEVRCTRFGVLDSFLCT